MAGKQLQTGHTSDLPSSVTSSVKNDETCFGDTWWGLMDKILKTKLLKMIKRVNKAMWAGGIMFGRKTNYQNPSRTMNKIYTRFDILSLLQPAGW